MELEVAKKICELAKGGGILDEIPADDAIVAEAEYFVREGTEAVEQEWGKEDPIVVAILAAAGIEVEVPEHDPEPQPKYESGVPPKSSGGFPANDLDSDTFPDEVMGQEPEVEATTYKNLPLPADIAEAVVTLPADLTALTDVEVRRLHSQFNTLLARATWVLSQASNELASAEHLFDDAYRKALKKVDKIDPYTEKAKIAKVLEAETMEDITVMARDADVQACKANVVSLKALRDVYASNVSVTSREWTMRQDEYEKGR